MIFYILFEGDLNLWYCRGWCSYIFLYQVMSEESMQYKIMRFFNEMDFESQKKAERFYMFVIIVTAIASYAVADVKRDFSVCVYSVLVAMVLCYIVCVPGQAPWWKKPFPKFRPEQEKRHNKKA